MTISGNLVVFSFAQGGVPSRYIVCNDWARGHHPSAGRDPADGLEPADLWQGPRGRLAAEPNPPPGDHTHTDPARQEPIMFYCIIAAQRVVCVSVEGKRSASPPRPQSRFFRFRKLTPSPPPSSLGGGVSCFAASAKKWSVFAYQHAGLASF